MAGEIGAAEHGRNGGTGTADQERMGEWKRVKWQERKTDKITGRHPVVNGWCLSFDVMARRRVLVDGWCGEGGKSGAL